MIISQITQSCVKASNPHNKAIQRAALAADIALPITLLALGILSLIGTLGLPMGLSWAYVGAGSVWIASTLIRLCLDALKARPERRNREILVER